MIRKINLPRELKMKSAKNKKMDAISEGKHYWRHLAGLETNARPRRVKFRPGEWFVRPDQPGGRVGIFRGFIDHIVIASLALISSGLSRQNEILNRVRLF